MNSGMQRMTFDFEAENPLEDMERLTKALHDRDQSVWITMLQMRCHSASLPKHWVRT